MQMLSGHSALSARLTATGREDQDIDNSKRRRAALEVGAGVSIEEARTELCPGIEQCGRSDVDAQRNDAGS